MTRIVDVVDAMADKIRAACDDALTATDLAVQVEPRRLLNPTPPAVDIYPADPFTDPLMSGFGDVMGPALVWTVRARIDTNDPYASQDLLLAMMDDEDPLSIEVALEDDQTLSGTASSVRVDGPSGYRFYEDISGQAFLGVEWRALVLRLQS